MTENELRDAIKMRESLIQGLRLENESFMNTNARLFRDNSDLKKQYEEAHIQLEEIKKEYEKLKGIAEDLANANNALEKTCAMQALKIEAFSKNSSKAK